MPYPNEHAARLRDPGKYTQFRRENDFFGAGIHAIWGILPRGKVELQAIRFDAQKFSVDEAKRWLEEHNYTPILFEPASAAETQAMTVPSGIYIRGEPGGLKMEAGGPTEDKSLRRFSMTAYTGGAMILSGWSHPVVIDTAGLQVGTKSRPILMNHDANRIVGHTEEVGVARGVLTITGIISGVGSAAREVVGASDNGFPWQASLGAFVRRVVYVPEGKTVTANGREFVGPIYVVRQAILGEVSFVPLGADDATTAKVEAGRIPVSGEEPTNMEGITMEFEPWVESKGFKLADLNEAQTASLKAMWETKTKGVETSEGESDATETVQSAVRAERDRVAAIQEICAGEFATIERDAIRLGWSVHETADKVLKAIRQNRPRADIHLVTRAEPDEAFAARTLEAALCLRAQIPEESLLKSYGEQVLERASAYREISLQTLLAECAQLEGKTVPRSFGNDTIRAAFSTVSLPGILSNVANKKLLKAFQAQPIVATRLCSEGELNDFKESERYRLTDVGDLEPVAPDGELKHGGLKEEKATNQVQTFGKVFCLTREMIYNDDLNAFMRVPEGMGARAARKIDQLFFTRLLSNPEQRDGKPLFHGDHGNWRDGADTALSGDSLALAIQLFLDQKDADGQPINVNPKFLLVPPSLKITARELLNSVTLMATGSTNRSRIPTYNALADEDIEVVVSPYLSNPNYAGASSKAWYLFADPAVVDTFEIGYLRGRRVPTVEQGETDFDTLGIKFRVYFDLGVREQDYRGMIKFKGEA